MTSKVFSSLIILLISILSVSSTEEKRALRSGAIILKESFEYNADEPLDGLSDWTVSSSSSSAIITKTLYGTKALKVVQKKGPGGASFLASRQLASKITSGTVWLSVLMSADKVGDGHMFISPSSTQSDAMIGKKWGRHISIHNKGASTSLKPDITYLLVAKYVLKDGIDDDVYLWINPSISNSEPQIAKADVKMKTSIPSIDRILLNIQHHGEGSYAFDDIRLARSYFGGAVDSSTQKAMDSSTRNSPTFSPMTVNKRMPWSKISHLVDRKYKKNISGLPEASVWLGDRVALVVEGDLDPEARDTTTMTKIVSWLDQMYNLFDKVTGQRPKLSNPYKGRIRIEASTQTGGGLAGHDVFGISVGLGYFTNLYKRTLGGDWSLDQIYYYEAARNYWGPKMQNIDYHTRDKPLSWGWWTVGFNNAMACFLAPEMGIDTHYHGRNGALFCASIEKNYLKYVSSSEYTWENSWNVDRMPWAQRTSLNDLMSGTLIHMHREFGGIGFISRLYRAIARQAPPRLKNEYQLARDNFYLASSIAAKRDLGVYFGETLKWEISDDARNAIKAMGSRDGFPETMDKIMTWNSPFLPPDILFMNESFEYGRGMSLNSLGAGATKESGWVTPWSVPSKSGGRGSIVNENLSYPGLPSSTGNALEVKHSSSFHQKAYYATRLTTTVFEEGVMWVCVLVRAKKVGSGHLFISFTPRGGGIGKAWGSNFSIDNVRSKKTMRQGKTHLLVAKYDISSQMIHLWVDQTISSNEPSTSSADVSKKLRVASVDRVMFNIQHHGDGAYVFDEIKIANSWSRGSSSIVRGGPSKVLTKKPTMAPTLPPISPPTTTPTIAPVESPFTPFWFPSPSLESSEEELEDEMEKWSEDYEEADEDFDSEDEVEEESRDENEVEEEPMDEELEDWR